MARSRADFTITWRELATLAAEDPEEVATERLLQAVQPAMPAPGRAPHSDQWTVLLRRWLRLLSSQRLTAEESSIMMRGASPKYIPREHLLTEAYAAARAGDLVPAQGLHHLLASPYDEHPGMEHEFYLAVGGTRKMS